MANLLTARKKKPAPKSGLCSIEQDVLQFYFLLVGPTSPLRRGSVTDAPSAPAEAPITADSLALGPSVTVLVQPVAIPIRKATIPIYVNVFFISADNYNTLYKKCKPIITGAEKV